MDNHAKPKHPPRVLVIEDEPDIAELIRLELSVEGYQVTVEQDGLRGLLAVRQYAPQLIILDRMLPGLDGLELCRRIRQTSTIPILMLSARGNTRERIEGLDAGANDYLPKPFNLDELLARVRAQLRVVQQNSPTPSSLGGLSVDTTTRDVKRYGVPILLTPREYDLMLYFWHHPRQVKTRNQIVDAVWGIDFQGDENVLEVTISNLRAKLEKQSHPRLIHTLRGVGYILREDTEA